ncbi:MAG: glutamine-hydrolyzing carbamoyl-phosphate synthase small subunit [Thermoguttaceae bacterium]
MASNLSAPSVARLVLEDGTEFHGFSFGSTSPTTSCSGEVVFNSTMVGYCESLTDPTLAGQILTLTWPLVGNTGVPPQAEENGLQKFFESKRIWVNGLIVSEYSPQYSHWNAVRSLGDWLAEEGVPAITGVDTRALAQHLRDKGTMSGKILIEGVAANEKPANKNLVAEVSCNEVIEYEPTATAGNNGKTPTVVLVDCGVKNNVIRSLTSRGVKVVRVPWNHDFTTMNYDGLVISNGPGDPSAAEETVANIQKAIKIGKPIFGICFGNLLLGKAAGAKTFRLRFGHHTSNQPVQQCGTDRTHVTPQNHGYALDPLGLASGWEQWFVNLNDKTCEGIRHKTAPFFGTQFHPENCGGPKNSENIYDMFVKTIKK